MNSQLEAFLQYQQSQGRFLAITDIDPDVPFPENVALNVPFNDVTIKGIITEFSIVEENRDERDWYGYNQALMLEFFAEWCDDRNYDFVHQIDGEWKPIDKSIAYYVDIWIDCYKKHPWDETRRYLVPMNRTHMDNLDQRWWAYGCMTQNVELVYAIQEMLGRYDIDAAMATTESGDYEEIYISFQEGVASYNAYKQWFKVVEK